MISGASLMSLESRRRTSSAIQGGASIALRLAAKRPELYA